MARSFQFDVDNVVERLNRILQMELAAVIYYTHYSFMIYGHARIPITSWLRDNATESLAHAQEAGQMIMRLHRRPALGIAALPTAQHNTIDEILAESIQREEAGASSRFRALNSISEIAGDSVRTSDAKPGAAGICVEFVACPSLPLPNSVTSTFDI